MVLPARKFAIESSKACGSIMSPCESTTLKVDTTAVNLPSPKDWPLPTPIGSDLARSVFLRLSERGRMSFLCICTSKILRAAVMRARLSAAATDGVQLSQNLVVFLALRLETMIRSRLVDAHPRTTDGG